MAERLKDYDYHALCYRVLRRDGWKCRNCGFRANLHVHHIWFRSQGGPDDIWNLVTLCNACHDGVHTAIKDGEHGLTVRVYAATGEVEFIAASWWRPGLVARRYKEEQNESSTEPDIVDVFIRAINRKSTTEDHAHIESLRSAARERGLGKREGK